MIRAFDERFILKDFSLSIRLVASFNFLKGNGIFDIWDPLDFYYWTLTLTKGPAFDLVSNKSFFELDKYESHNLESFIVFPE